MAKPIASVEKFNSFIEKYENQGKVRLNHMELKSLYTSNLDLDGLYDIAHFMEYRGITVLSTQEIKNIYKIIFDFYEKDLAGKDITPEYQGILYSLMLHGLV